MPPRFTDQLICESIEFILDKDVFHFNGKFYIQTKVTAMGTKFTPCYANLVLAYLEENMHKDL